MANRSKRSQKGKLVKVGKNGKPVQTSQNGIQQKLLKSLCYWDFDLFWPVYFNRLFW